MTIAYETIQAARELLDKMETPRSRKASDAWDKLRAKINEHDAALATDAEKEPFDGNDELEIDDKGTLASRGGDGGHWLSAWVWIASPDEDDEGIIYHP